MRSYLLHRSCCCLRTGRRSPVHGKITLLRLKMYTPQSVRPGHVKNQGSHSRPLISFFIIIMTSRTIASAAAGAALLFVLYCADNRNNDDRQHKYRNDQSRKKSFSHTSGSQTGGISSGFFHPLTRLWKLALVIPMNGSI